MGCRAAKEVLRMVVRGTRRHQARTHVRAHVCVCVCTRARVLSNGVMQRQSSARLGPPLGARCCGSLRTCTMHCVNGPLCRASMSSAQ